MKKRKRRVKKKILTMLIPLCIVLAIIFILYFGYNILFKEKEKNFLEKINTTTYADITKYAIYGIHMNLEGKITLAETPNEITLVLSNGKEEMIIPWEVEENNNTYIFKTSNYINSGVNLETLKTGEYYFLIKTEKQDENDKTLTNYYSVNNKTNYKDLEYYSLTKNQKNNKINIEWNTYEECPTLKFTIKETKLPDDVYDITIDPGHDASDSGKTGCDDGSTPSVTTGYCYSGNTIKEANVNLTTALKLKDELEALGYKVAMTRTTENDYVDVYGPNGSATMANDTKSKFNFALHHNSSGVVGGVSYLNGVEIYIANDIILDFAELLMKNIVSFADTNASSKSQYAVANGIYQRFFTEKEISEDEVQPSNKTTNTIYYYNIREIGGISTNATNDGRYLNTSSKYPKNEHYNSNNTAESYLLELGYMDNYEDLLNIINNPDGYAKGIATALQSYLSNK